MKLSERMIEAGWVIQRERNGSFTVFGSGLQRYRFDSQSNNWSDDLKAIEFSLEQDRTNKLSPLYSLFPTDGVESHKEYLPARRLSLP